MKKVAEVTTVSEAAVRVHEEYAKGSWTRRVVNCTSNFPKLTEYSLRLPPWIPPASVSTLDTYSTCSSSISPNSLSPIQCDLKLKLSSLNHSLTGDATGSVGGKNYFQRNGKRSGKTTSHTNAIPSPSISYFEFVERKGEAKAIAVGVCGGQFSLDKLPGWEKTSMGIHSDDGKLFLEGDWKKLCEPWECTDEVVGLGFHHSTRTPFLTLQGELVTSLPPLSQSFKGPLYPVIGVSDRAKNGCQFEINLEGPFEFDPSQFSPPSSSSSPPILCAWGSRSFGKLGTASGSSKLVPQRVSSLPAGLSVQSLSCGHSHTLLLSGNGEIYGWGSNYERQLGENKLSVHSPHLLNFEQRNDKEDPPNPPPPRDHSNIQPSQSPSLSQTTLAPSPLPSNHDFRLVSAGDTHSVAVRDDELYMWGAISDHCLAIPLTNITSSFPVSPAPRIVQIASSRYRSVALTDKGKVLYWGNFPAASPPSSEASSSCPPIRLLKGLPIVKKVAVGPDHLFCLTESGVIYVWSAQGSPKKLQLTESHKSTTFTSISASYNHFCAVSSSGSIFSWSTGQLSQSSSSPAADVAPDSNSSQLSIEWRKARGDSSFTCFHVIGCGSVPFVDVECGWKHLLGVKANGSLESFGEGSYAGLRGTSYYRFSRPLSLPSSSHSVCTVLDGVVGCGPLHSVVGYRENAPPWSFTPELREDAEWEVMGYGENPPRKLLLPLSSFASSASDSDKLSLDSLLAQLNLSHSSPSSSCSSYSSSLSSSSPSSTSLSIEKVYLLDHPNLSAAFKSECEKMKHKMSISPSSTSSSTSSTTTTPSSPVPVEVTQKTYSKFCDKFHWNSNQEVKVIPVLHGTNASAAWKIAEGGFVALGRRDGGKYGQGIYLTTNAKYATSYSSHSTLREETKRAAGGSGSSDDSGVGGGVSGGGGDDEGELVVLLLCYCVPGNVRAVNQDPEGGDSLSGKAISPGFNSHYVLVDEEGAPLSSSMYEESMKEMGGSERVIQRAIESVNERERVNDCHGEIYDELVVSQESQVLPRYIIYARKHTIPTTSNSLSSSSSLLSSSSSPLSFSSSTSSSVSSSSALPTPSLPSPLSTSSSRTHVPVGITSVDPLLERYTTNRREALLLDLILDLQVQNASLAEDLKRMSERVSRLERESERK